MVRGRDDRNPLWLRDRKENYGLTRSVVDRNIGRRGGTMSWWREIRRSVEIRRRDREFWGFGVIGLHFLERIWGDI